MLDAESPLASMNAGLGRKISLQLDSQPEFKYSKTTSILSTTLGLNGNDKVLHDYRKGGISMEVNKPKRRISLQVEYENVLSNIRKSPISPTAQSNEKMSENTDNFHGYGKNGRTRKISLQMEPLTKYTTPTPPTANKPERKRSFVIEEKSVNPMRVGPVRKASVQMGNEGIDKERKQTPIVVGQSSSKTLGLKEGEVVLDSLKKTSIRTGPIRKSSVQSEHTSTETSSLSHIRSRRRSLQEGRDKLLNECKRSEASRKISLQSNINICKDPRNFQMPLRQQSARRTKSPFVSSPIEHDEDAGNFLLNSHAKLPPIPIGSKAEVTSPYDENEDKDVDGNGIDERQLTFKSEVDTSTFIKESISDFVIEQELSAYGEEALQDGDSKSGPTKQWMSHYDMCAFDEEDV